MILHSVFADHPISSVLDCKQVDDPGNADGKLANNNIESV
jgi:hypothetical protein